MANPYLNRNESILLATHKVMVKSVSSDVLLTSQRLIIVDSGHEQFLPHSIPLAVIETVTYRENPDGDPEISLSITPPTPDDAPVMIALVFSQAAGETRAQESGEWVTKLRGGIATAREIALRTGEKPVYPETEAERGKAPSPLPAAGDGTVRLSLKKQSSQEPMIPRSPPAVSGTGYRETAPASPYEAPVAEGPAPPAETAGEKARPPVQIPPATRARTPKRSTIFVVTAIIAFIFVIAAGLFLVSSSIQEKSPAPAGSPIVSPAVPPPTTGTTAVPTQTETIPATPVPPVQVTPAIPEKPLFIVPQAGVWVQVITTGNFTGSVGPAGRMEQVTGAGNQFYQIPARDEIVEATIQKQDGSGNPLTVEIYNNGAIAGNATITSPNGVIDLHVNLKTP